MAPLSPKIGFFFSSFYGLSITYLGPTPGSSLFYNGDYDFFVVSDKSLKKMAGRIDRLITPLGNYKKFLSRCGGFDRPFISINNKMFGIKIGNSKIRKKELPEFLDFLANSRQNYILSATNKKALAKKGNYPFYYLTHLILSIAHNMPIIEGAETQHKIRLGNKITIRPKDKRISSKIVKRNQKTKEVTFDLTFRSNDSEPIRDLEVYFFNSPSERVRECTPCILGLQLFFIEIS